MNTLQKIFAAIALSAPLIGSGCTKEVEQKHSRKIISRQDANVLSIRLTKDGEERWLHQLCIIRDVVPGIDQWDENNDLVVDRKEAAKYILEFVCNGKGKITFDDALKVKKEIIDKILDLCSKETFLSPNIRETAWNFQLAIDDLIEAQRPKVNKNKEEIVVAEK